jgi:hypothetical protein
MTFVTSTTISARYIKTLRMTSAMEAGLTDPVLGLPKL